MQIAEIGQFDNIACKFWTELLEFVILALKSDIMIMWHLFKFYVLVTWLFFDQSAVKSPISLGKYQRHVT